MPMPRRTVALRCHFQKGMVGGVVQAWHGMCESNTAALSDYPNFGFPVHLPLLQGKDQDKTHTSQSFYFTFIVTYIPFSEFCAYFCV
jgi:hypothetical protein